MTKHPHRLFFPRHRLTVATQARHIALYESYLKIILRRENGKITWTQDEINAAQKDGRRVFMGALDLTLE